MALIPGTGVAGEPCLLAYPMDAVVFHYNSTQYDAISSSHPNYDPSYGVSGLMLWDYDADRVAAEVYRAPGLNGFETSPSGDNEFFNVGNITTIRIDGFSDTPRQLNDIFVEFRPYPFHSTPNIYVNDDKLDGLRYYIPRLVVSTPTEDGFYADVIDVDVKWNGAQTMTIIVFADKNGNRVLDGEPMFRIVMEDWTVPTENKTWGAIKALYKNP
ncbi:MAG: hypothetical protein JSW50_03240 [Candidatus Latescibacterota bacterium]|nr:MAG: hypothetical protein JSW50_03240 [Candidatus Latescibacterota bacterium]